MFHDLSTQPPDPLLALIGLYARDPRPRKIDLGVGVYRDEFGRTPVFAAVKEAEERLLKQQTTKAYLGPEGDLDFVAQVIRLAFAGSEDAGRLAITGVQTTGGTGALRLAAELITQASPNSRLWLGHPTWPNHAPLFQAAGLAVCGFEYFDPLRQRLLPERLLNALHTARRGDAVLLHACCHNPTGADPDTLLLTEIAQLLRQRELLPVIDMAYQGLGDGVEHDSRALRRLVAAVPEALIAYSCDKNFGLYRERVGALLVSTGSLERSVAVRSHLAALARVSTSMPPDHGAAVVRTILEDAELSRQWRRELDRMCGRLNQIRAALATRGKVGRLDLTPLARQRGLFALLPLKPEEVLRLREDHAIYMAPSGRINLAGLTLETVPTFVEALHAVMLAQPA